MVIKNQNKKGTGKILLTLFVTIFVLHQTGQAIKLAGEGELTAAKKQLLKESRKVAFEENKGQVKDQYWQPRPDVLFSGSSQGMDFHLRRDGFSLQLKQVQNPKENDSIDSSLAAHKHMKAPARIDIYRVDINWLGTTTPSSVEKGSPLPGYSNYYNVPEGSEPALMVLQYETLRFKNVWPGVDLYYHAKNGFLESEWLLEKAEAYRQISFEIKGAVVSLEEDCLILKTPFGEIREGALKVYQGGKEIKAGWVLAAQPESVRVSFQIAGYDPAKALKIDPPIRQWGTYYGGAVLDYGYSCAADDSSNVYLAGETGSTYNIATTGAHQSLYGGGFDAFLAKFKSSGERLWGTYYGGSGEDGCNSCATDGSGNVYTGGFTESASNIATAGAHQATPGGSQNAFLVKFNSNGVRLWGTYYGGSALDEGHSCATDGSDNVYLAGETWTSNNIASPGANQTFLYGVEDAFIAKFNSDGVRQWGTYYGGSDQEWGFSCAADDSSNVYLAGGTYSTNNIATTGAHQTNLHGFADAFIAKFNSSGVRQWATYYGGSDQEWGYSCATDGSGNVYLAGTTYSGDNISTTGAHQTGYSGYIDAFIAKFNGGGVRQWGTYYGGLGTEDGRFCTTDGSGNVYMAGETSSRDSIATTGAHQISSGGATDAFLVKFSSGGICQWGTYYGGTKWDNGFSCSTDGNGNLYLAGYSVSTNNIATAGSHQNSYGGGQYDAFLVNFIQNTGINETGASGGILLYPNPVSQTMVVELSRPSKIEVYDVFGKFVMKSSSAKKHELNFSALPAGVYFIHAGSSVAKVIKQ